MAMWRVALTLTLLGAVGLVVAENAEEGNITTQDVCVFVLCVVASVAAEAWLACSHGCTHDLVQASLAQAK